MQKLKNLIGDLLEYGRCPVTGDTYWHSNYVAVPYSPTSGVWVSARALDEYSKEYIAQRVYYRSQGMVSKDLTKYSLEEIMEQIPHSCMHFPRG